MTNAAFVLILLLIIVLIAGLPQFKLHDYGDRPSVIALCLIVLIVVLLLANGGGPVAIH